MEHIFQVLYYFKTNTFSVVIKAREFYFLIILAAPVDKKWYENNCL